MKPSGFRLPYGVALAGGAGLGGVLAALDRAGFSFQGWLAYGLLSSAALVTLVWVWRRLGSDHQAGIAVLVTFLVRLAAGVALTLLLPRFGHPDSQVTQAGYVYYDAFLRDRQAWGLANTSQPLWSAFEGEYPGDQYGGMLALSALVYRTLSRDAHRPALILVLTAASGALAVLFLWGAARTWFTKPVPLAAAWILALYPEAVLLAGSQMREAFLIFGVALAFYGLTRLQSGSRWQATWLVAAVVLLFAFSPLVAVPVLGILAGLWFLDPDRRPDWRQAALIGGLLVAGLALAITALAQYPSLERAGPGRIIIEWFQNNLGFQAYLLERSSGWVQKLFREAGSRWETPIVLVYGLARPVLPATLTEPAPWIWRTIGTLRAAGWYALTPFLVYGTTRLLGVRTRERRAQMLWLGLVVWAWILLAAFVGGGDQFDNPRYRTILIAWQALLAAWAWSYARAHQDAWLGRWLLVEGIFLLFFTQWYLSRYYRWFGRLPFWQMVSAILALSALVLAGGWFQDRRRARSAGQDGASPPDTNDAST